MSIVNKVLGDAMTPEQKSIYKNPRLATLWAVNHGQRFPEAEPYIANDSRWAHYYAKDVIKGRWPEAEKITGTDPYWSYYYARDVIQGRWPEGEEAIVKDPQLAYDYAINVIKGRWPEAEETIVNSEYKDQYLKAFPDAKDDWLLNGWIDWLDT